MPKVELVTSSEAQGDAVALAWFQEDAPAKSEKEKGDKEKADKVKVPSLLFVGKRGKDFEKLNQLLRASKHFGGRKNETDFLRYVAYEKFSNVLIVGLGTEKKFNPETARQAGAALFAVQKRGRLAKVVLQADSLFANVPEGDLFYYVQALTEGYLMASYDYRDLKKADPSVFQPKGLDLAGLKSSTKAAVQKGTALASAVHFARGLGDRPGNFLTPSDMARLVVQMGKEHKLKCTVLGRAEMEKEKMGLFLGVAQGSDEEPKLIVMEHRGGKKGDKVIALVGKGVTFDSGGISLKPAHQMEDMKYDMMGAAAVAGIMQAVAELDLPLNVIGYIGATENLPSGTAQKPGDVKRSLSGKTVEIVNTDAEGRLVLADVIEYAQRQEPQALMDFATLTGAVVVALGTVTTGIMGTHRPLLERVKSASEATAERVWELPLYEEYEEDLKSFYADIKNSGTRDAGASKGGTFLKYFVDAKIPWVHFDIAGAAYHRKDLNYHPSRFAAGVMVRLATHLLENWKPL